MFKIVLQGQIVKYASAPDKGSVDDFLIKYNLTEIVESITDVPLQEDSCDLVINHGETDLSKVELWRSEVCGAIQ